MYWLAYSVASCLASGGFGSVTLNVRTSAVVAVATDDRPSRSLAARSSSFSLSRTRPPTSGYATSGYPLHDPPKMQAPSFQTVFFPCGRQKLTSFGGSPRGRLLQRPSGVNHTSERYLVSRGERRARHPARHCPPRVRCCACRRAPPPKTREPTPRKQRMTNRRWHDGPESITKCGFVAV